MKKFKSLKKLMVSILAVVTVFSTTGSTIYAATGIFGGKEIDLDSNAITVKGAKEDFVNDITTKNVHFTNSSKINLALTNGLIYGTSEEPIKKKYETKIKLDNSYNLAFEWNEQERRVLDEEYNFVNKIPEKINVPVPFFFEEGEANASGWNFDSGQMEGYTNTKVNISNLRDLFSNKDSLKNGYTFKSKEFAYTPQVGYINTEGSQKYTSNNGSWFFDAPMSVQYTVDIKPLNAGGTPTLGGNNSLSIPKIKDTNKIYFRNDVEINNYENSYNAPDGTTDKVLKGYGEKYSVKGTTLDDSIVIMKTTTKVADPISGEGKATGAVEGTVGGKTHIEVEYGKVIKFLKVDENDKPITSAAADFTVYEDQACTKDIGTVSSSTADGVVQLPVLRMPEKGETVSYYMQETKAPQGYEKNEGIFIITINDTGAVTISGEGISNGNVVNSEIKEPTIVKSSNPVPGENVKNGDKIDYILTVTNNYNKDRKITVKDVLPTEVKFDASKPYIIKENGKVVASGNRWDGQWNGKIKADSTLEIVIPVIIIKDFDNQETSNNVITNQASLLTKKLNSDDYGEEQFTNEVVHYLTPKVSYTMEKERVTQPKDGLKGFIAGADEVVSYKVTLKNTGNLDLQINLKDVFEKSTFFRFVGSDEVKDLMLKVDEEKVVTFKATVNTETPENVNKGYLNTVISEGEASYLDPKDGKTVITVNKTTQPDLEKNSMANTPVIVVGDPSIVKTSDIKSESFVQKGSVIIYTLTVTNPYNVARKILVTDVLPKQVTATDDYLINGKSQDNAWDGNYEGTIEANGELVFEIPVTVITSFNNKDHESNTILNQAYLKAKDLLTDEFGEKILTEEIIHYLNPMISYTMTKERITQPKEGLSGFYAGTGQIIDYKVTLVNTGDITLDVDLEDVFINDEYFEFIEGNQAGITIEPGETREVIFKAAIKAETPANPSYENIVIATAQGSYLDAQTTELVLVNKENWPDAIIEDDALTPVIAPEVKPTAPEKPSVETGDDSSIALFGSLALLSGLTLIAKRKKED